MEPRALLEILEVAERLKDATRHCYTSKGRHESVAEHSWMSLRRFEWIQELLIIGKDLPDQAYVDMLCDEIYSRLFEN